MAQDGERCELCGALCSWGGLKCCNRCGLDVCPKCMDENLDICVSCAEDEYAERGEESPR